MPSSSLRTTTLSQTLQGRRTRVQSEDFRRCLTISLPSEHFSTGQETKFGRQALENQYHFFAPPALKRFHIRGYCCHILTSVLIVAFLSIGIPSPQALSKLYDTTWQTTIVTPLIRPIHTRPKLAKGLLGRGEIPTDFRLKSFLACAALIGLDDTLVSFGVRPDESEIGTPAAFSHYIPRPRDPPPNTSED